MAPVRVDPTVLHDTAGIIDDVSAGVVDGLIGSVLSGVAARLGGLASGPAAEKAGNDVDDALATTHDELDTLSGGLRTAAGRYTRSDEQAGTNINQVGQTMVT